MARVSALWRHPIKSHGREALDRVLLMAGQSMPWDRHWAVTHEASKVDAGNPSWVMCRNFMIGVATPGLQAIWAQLDEDTRTITLTHDKLGAITFCPDNGPEVAEFLHWVQPLCPPEKRQPTGIVALPQRGFTDAAYPCVSILNTASHKAVAGRLGRTLEPERWRGNIWLDGQAPWEEFDMTGQEITLGGARLLIREPIRRCMVTAANPRTGLRDTDTLGLLADGWDHQHFGVYAEVLTGGEIALGDLMTP